MSVQEPQDQFGRESVEDKIEESQDSVDESLLPDSDSDTSSRDSEPIDVPAPTNDAEAPSEDAAPDEPEEIEVPAIESMPVSSSDELPAPEPTEGPAWYVIHCYSGYENKVRHNLEQRIETMGMKDRIFDVVIPTQEEIEVKDGKRRTVERHIFPGYVLVNMVLTEESWYVVRNTPGVTGFVGMGNNPTPLRPEEVAQIVKRMEAEAPTVKVTFKVGERVRIIDGPFNDFRGVVSEIDMERTKVRVMVSFFGRETPVELDFLQVEKA
jgi:transcriptional antiterminator NusG